jgi:LysM repeat protein
MGKKGLLILISSLLGVCLLVSLAGAAAYYFLAPGRQAGPAVLIKAPRHGEEVSANEMMEVQAIARDKSGVTRVELWVDGELTAAKTSQLPEGSTPFPLIEGWQPGSPGKHTLIVRAYNLALRSGQASVVVEALDVPKPEPTPMAHEVQAGDTLETIAIEYDVSAEDIAENNPGLEEPLEPGETVLIPPPPPEEEEAPRPEEAPPEPLSGEGPPDLSGPEAPLPLMASIPVRLIGVPLIPTISLEVEALSLEVDKDYDGVYCYVSLAGSAMERVPGEGYLETPGERRWGIEAQMGGENKRTVAIPEGEGPLSISLNCIGYNESEEGGIIYDLGTLAANHYKEEWDGRLIEQEVSGMHGWFKVGYRINPAGVEESEEPILHLPPPTNLSTGAVWGWDGYWNGFFFEYPSLLIQPGVDFDIRFSIYRNGNLLYDDIVPRFVARTTDPDYNQWFVPLSNSNFYPSCPNRNEFYMTAYVDDPALGHIETIPSNSVFTEGDPVPCYRSKVVRLSFEELETGCLDVDDYVIQHLCTRGCAGLRTCCDCNHDPRDWPIPFGDVWVNGEKAHPGLWQDFDSSRRYDVSRFLRPIDLLLGPLDDLTITMKLWDDDVWSGDDKFCPGEYTIGHWELDELAKSLPGEKRRTYDPEFSNDNGTCWLKFTVEVLAEFQE